MSIKLKGRNQVFFPPANFSNAAVTQPAYVTRGRISWKTILPQTRGEGREKAVSEDSSVLQSNSTNDLTGDIISESLGHLYQIL